MSYAQLVTISKFEELTGYTDRAVQTKIERGVFIQGLVWIKAPDGRILIDVEGFHRWARNQQGCPVASKSTARN